MWSRYNESKEIPTANLKRSDVIIALKHSDGVAHFMLITENEYEKGYIIGFPIIDGKLQPEVVALCKSQTVKLVTSKLIHDAIVVKIPEENEVMVVSDQPFSLIKIWHDDAKMKDLTEILKQRDLVSERSFAPGPTGPSQGNLPMKAQQVVVLDFIAIGYSTETLFIPNPFTGPRIIQLERPPVFAK